MLLRSHGVTRDQTKIMDNPKEPWVYDQVELGFNYRMTDIQAALGFSQLDRIENFIKKRNLIADRYNQKLKNLNLILPFQSSTCLSSYHLYPIQTENRIQFFNQMQKHRIRVNVHYRPIHTQPYS